MKRAALSSLSWATMSRWTAGVAVAVRAMMGAGRSDGQVVAERAVVGAEVVAPGGDAVGLVDGDEGGLALGEHLGEAGDAHALGGDEEELEGAVEVVAAGLAGLFAVEPGVDAGDLEAGGGELGGLVVHQGDERADDQGGAAAGDGGKLVAEALAGAGGHDEQDVAAVGGGAADGLLVGAEGGEAEGLLEEGGELHGAGSVSHVLRVSGWPGAWGGRDVRKSRLELGRRQTMMGPTRDEEHPHYGRVESHHAAGRSDGRQGLHSGHAGHGGDDRRADLAQGAASRRFWRITPIWSART